MTTPTELLVLCPCGCRTLMTFQEMWEMLYGGNDDDDTD